MIKKGASRFAKEYMQLWDTLKGWKLFAFFVLHYTVLFLILQRFAFTAFYAADKSFVWSQDAMPQYFTTMVYKSQTIRDGIQALLTGKGWTFPLYDFRIGPTKTSLEFESLQWLAVAWPWDKIDVLYDILTVTRFYLVGLSFSLFGFYFKQRPIGIIIGAVSYAFCGFSLFGALKHPQFLAPMILLPLLMIGAESLIQGKKSILFVVTVCFALWSSLYFACMLAILTVIYILIRSWCVYCGDFGNQFARLCARIAAYGGTGVLLGCCVAIPSLSQMAGTGRIGRELLNTNLLTYNQAFYATFLNNFLLIPSVSGWTCLGFSVLALPAVILLFVKNEKKHKTLRLCFLVLTLMMLCPGATYALSGFNSLSARWCFGYAFCVAAILMFMFTDLTESNKIERAVIIACVVVYFLISYFINWGKSFQPVPFVLLIATLVLISCVNIVNIRKKQIISIICIVATCTSVIYSSLYRYSPTNEKLLAEFADKNKEYEYLSSGQYAMLGSNKTIQADKDFFRVTGNSIITNELGASFFFGLNGLSRKGSLYYESFENWLNDLEKERVDSFVPDYGNYNRAAMTSMCSIKYYAEAKSDKSITPYGFQTIDSITNEKRTDTIETNKYWLPVGYTYDSYMPISEYEGLNGLEKQEVQLQAIVLPNTPDSCNIQPADVTISGTKIPYKITDSKGVRWKNGKLKVSEEKATMTLTFSGMPKTETYLRVVNLDLSTGSSTRKWTLNADTGMSTANAYFCADAYMYSHGQKTQLLHLGYTEEGYTTITITFPAKGTFILDDLEIWCQPMDRFADQINALREESLENVETNWRGLTGTISVSKDKMLCISVPYDKGWSAYVDGQKVKLYQANTAFMAVELSAGDHTVEIRYWTPGLTMGIALSGVGAICLIGLLIFQKKSGKKAEKRVRNEKHDSGDRGELGEGK